MKTRRKHRQPRMAHRSRGIATGCVFATLATVAASSYAAASTPSSLRQVFYRGYTFQVPRTWNVINLADHPRRCVRFDRHVVYLGVPGRNQSCPSALGWSRPTFLSTGVASAPFAVTSAVGSVNVFWTGAGGGLWWAARQGTIWQPPVPLAMGPMGGGPFAAGQGDGMIDVFWHGSADSHLWHARYSGSWVGPGDLGGSDS